MKTRDRREFLKESGVLMAGAAFRSRLSAGVRQAVSDAPKPAARRQKMRGLMVDAGRVPESLEYYRRVIEFCAQWGLNTLHFRLADDQGSALRFESAPDLVMHKNAFTPEELNALAVYVQKHGVDVIPELESFGHTGYITRSPKYAHLLDAEGSSSEFTGVIPVDPEVLRLFDSLYREVAAIFPSAYLHGGCDEVNWGGSEQSRRALQAKTRAQIWADYLNALNHTAQGLEKQLIVWGDFVLHKEPEILARLNKNVIIMDWNYREMSPAKVGDALEQVRASGFRGIGAPGLIHYRWGARAGTEQLRNIDAYAETYLYEDDAGSLGVVLTNWVPSRYLQNSIWDGFVYAAVAFNDGAATAQSSGLRRFVERHYRAKWNDAWSEAFQLIYENAPHVAEHGSSAGTGLNLVVPWSNDQQLAAVLSDRSSQQNPFPRLRGLLAELEPQVLDNLSDFQAFALCVEYLEQLYWRENVILEQAAGKPIDRETAYLLIKGIAERDQMLAQKLSNDWDAGRFPDSEAKLEPLYGFRPKDQLLFQWEQATKYSASLAKSPERFYQLLQTQMM